MRNLFVIIILAIIALSCNHDDVNIFDDTAAERSAAAIQNLKQELIKPASGWLVKYNPESGAGSYFVVLKFNENNTLRIQTDFGEENGKFFDDTITYRIDNSLNLELIFENFSFFSYLYELDDASFGAEFEFLYANKTGDDLVFTSKSDVGAPTIFVLTPAAENDAVTVLSGSLALKMNEIASDFSKLTSSLKMSYQDKDLAFYFSLDNTKRVINITSASKLADTSNPDLISFNAGYSLKNDSIVFDNPLTGTFQGYEIALKAIYIGDLTNLSMNVCDATIDLHGLNGTTSEGDAVVLETSLEDPKGARFESAEFYVCPPQNMVKDKVFNSAAVYSDLPGVLALQLYYNYGGTQADDGFFAMGFVLQKTDGSIYFLLRQFTPTLVGNKLIFNWTDELTVYNSQTSEVDLANAEKYLDEIAVNGAYIFEYNENVYEFYNPCTNWSYVFINANQ
jgi:hypothetical protein